MSGSGLLLPVDELERSVWSMQHHRLPVLVRRFNRLLLSNLFVDFSSRLRKGFGSELNPPGLCTVLTACVVAVVSSKQLHIQTVF